MNGVIETETYEEVKKMRVETEYEMDRIKNSQNNGVFLLDPLDKNEFVLSIRKKCEMGLVGGKALNISTLAKKGFSVPDGFCITTKAYDYFMDFNDISEEDERISDKIEKALMPPLLAEGICDAYRNYLSGRPCAVRSSSTVEDLKSASFAGQYKSILNVKDEDALLEAVKECWASLWGEPATAYRKSKGIANENIKMAVLVQEMLPALVSGVLFIDDQITVEAVWGLGDILVGGKVIPDSFLVEREEFNVVERKISHKEVMSHMTSTGGVDVVDVPEHLRAVPAVDDDTLRELCVLSKKVQKLFDCPQDIEWALYNGEIVLLQARPMTVKQEPTVWSRANISEMQPGYVTYLSRPPENKPDFFVFSTLPLLECVGITEVPENVKFVEYIYGHIYLNMNNLHDVLCKVPGFSPEWFDRAVGHDNIEEEQGSKLGLSEIPKLLPGALKAIRFLLNLPSTAEQVISYSSEFIESIKAKDLQGMGCEELDNLVWEMYDRNQKVFQIHTCNALIHAALFDKIRKSLKEIGEEGTENLLITGLEGMSSYEPGVEMWKLSQIAAKSPTVSELILSQSKTILKDLEQFQEGRAFLEELQDFIERFDYRCSEEPEISVPRWSETPDFVMSMVAHYLRSTADPVKKKEEEKRMRIEATDRILIKLSKSPLEKLIFKKMLRRVQGDTVTRENLKTTWAKGLSSMRLLYLAIAEKLVDKGTLENRDDIFYLKMTEVSDIIAGTLKREHVKGFLEERKKEETKYRHLDVPMVVVGKPPPVEELKCTVEPKQKLEGIGCSHGVITGKARVIFDPGECSDFEEGEILVAPVTDPGWSPLFVTAGGLVMELGSRTSHGIIIAREYGIPAVVGVRNATKIIKTGQLITVDGNKGKVHIRE
jgi:pyruvate,water dikinase